MRNTRDRLSFVWTAYAQFVDCQGAAEITPKFSCAAWLFIAQRLPGGGWLKATCGRVDSFAAWYLPAALPHGRVDTCTWR